MGGRGKGWGKGNSYQGGRGKGKGKGAPRVMSWTRPEIAGADGQDSRPPIVAHKQTVLDELAAHGIIIISGETGCGKSTQVPQFLLDQHPNNKIVVTQPRRLAARALAERVSVERGSAIGRTVGYAVSRDRVTTMGSTRLTFMTVGLLLQLLVFRAKEVTRNYTHIIVDEAHERDVDLDLLLLLLRRQLRCQHAAKAAAAGAADGAAEADGAAPAPAAASKPPPPLKVVIMSASIDAAAFAAYFDGCSLSSLAPAPAAASSDVPAALPPCLNVGSRKQPVGTYCLEAIQAALADAGPPSVTVEAATGNAAAKLHPSVYGLVEFLLKQLLAGTLFTSLPDVPEGVDASGGVLVFLPGFAEIQECLKALKRGGLAADAGLLLMPLHSLQEAEEQSGALAKPRGGMRKVILATNIAESSITVPDVSLVIDFGLEKLPFFNARANTDALLLRRCSAASAIQRAGRAGRVSPGVCLRLYPATFLADPGIMPPFTPAEMQRTSLSNLILKVKMIDPAGDPAALLREAIAPPTQTRVDEAVTSLVRLGAMTPGEAPKVTPIGKLVAALPVSVSLGRLLLLGEALGVGRQAAILVALLSLPDPFLQPYTKDAAADPDDAVAESAAAAEDAAFFAPRLAHFAKRGGSDPLASLQLFDEWQKILSDAGSAAAAKYAHSQHASYKRLAEVEHLSRELTQKVRQQRVEFGISLPPAVSGGGGAPPAPSLLTMQALLTAAFSPNFASGAAYCPTKVLEEVVRNKLDPRSAVYFLVAQDKGERDGGGKERGGSGSGGGGGGAAAHLTQEHLAAALQPCGELKQALISKSRVPMNGAMVLQTSALLSFATPTAALLALRMAGLKGTLSVPLTDAAGAPAGTARLHTPQYACRLQFERHSKLLDTEPEDDTPMAIAAAENAAAAAACAASLAAAGIGTGAAQDGTALPVELNWHSGSAVLSDEEIDGGPRYLLASAWSRAGHSRRLVAQQATLLPAKPHGAAELLMLAFSRSVTLLAAPGGGGGAAAAYVADGDVGLRVPLPFLLTAEGVEEINGLRSALSGCLSALPRDHGESASSLQLRLMRLAVQERPPIPAALAVAAAAEASRAPPPPAPPLTTELLPALLLPETPAHAADHDENGHGRPTCDGEPPAKRQAVGGGGAAADGADDDDMLGYEAYDLELLDG